ncbi:unnamed protein product [Ambrosiozyma monospora]|uniref:Unnamed protein product n=1 Tax=Ambrosiozyma monospora TaxID=43982 RepID=A0ACB5TCS4_AMBMO|nr:unnamed protein product [Ambrosiozyma monospora]
MLAKLSIALLSAVSTVLSAPLHYDPVLRPTMYDRETLRTITDETPVKQIHSHNDYWRERPLLTALSNGVQSVEADVWYYGNQNQDETIYVGHNFVSLTGIRTFQSLYIDPLYNILDLKNVQRELDEDLDDRTKPSGVFEMDSGKTLYLFVDFKTDGNATFEPVYNALKPLRDQGWLTTYNTTTDKLDYSAVTVIGTGNTPLDKVKALTTRDFFFDGPLGDLDGVTPGISPIASGSLNEILGQVCC